jgi:hypothetical protein
MDLMTQQQHAETFRALHRKGDPFVLSMYGMSRRVEQSLRFRLQLPRFQGAPRRIRLNDVLREGFFLMGIHEGYSMAVGAAKCSKSTIQGDQNACYPNATSGLFGCPRDARGD